MKSIELICKICGKTFKRCPSNINDSPNYFCSRECLNIFRAQQASIKRRNNYVECNYCHNKFYRAPRKQKQTNFCCQEHQIFFSRGYVIDKDGQQIKYKKDKICKVCGKKYYSYNNKYCSRKCFEIAHKENMAGNKNPSYIDGRTYNKNEFRGINWKESRTKCYIRDNYTCVYCGVKCVSKANYKSDCSDRIIQCHHIIPYRISKDNSLSNLVTCCLKCHNKKTKEEKIKYPIKK